MIAKTGNAPISICDPTAHAEILALRDGAYVSENYRLGGMSLYVTLEPCTMCAGAISNARIARVIYGASDPKGGAVEHGVRFFDQPTCHHRPGRDGRCSSLRVIRDFKGVLSGTPTQMKLSLRETLAPPASEGADETPDMALSGVVLGIVAAVLYSLKAIFVKLAYLPGEGMAEQIPPITLMMLRLGFSFPVYLAILIWVWRKAAVKPTLRQCGLAMSAGVLAYYICTFLDFSGLQYITAQLERLLLFTYPAFVILFGALFFGGRLTAWGVASVAVAYSGLAVVFIGGDITESSNLWLGSGLVLASAMLFALFQLIAKTFIDKIGPQLFTCLAMLGAATAIFTHFLVSALTADGIRCGLRFAASHLYFRPHYCRVFSTLLPSFFMNIAIGRIGAQRVAMLGHVWSIGDHRCSHLDIWVNLLGFGTRSARR